MTDLIQNHGVIAQPLPAPVVEALRAATETALDDLAAGDPTIAKVYEAFKAFKAKHTQWAALSEAPYHAITG